MERYGRDYRRASPATRPGRADPEAGEALQRQLREERAFQRERAAPGEELGWDDAESRPAGHWHPHLRHSPTHWQPPETPVAADLMTENPEAVTAEATLTEAARRMRELDVGILPVVDAPRARRLLGVITDRDIAVRAIAEGRDGTATVGECMTRQVEACGPDDRIREVLKVMEREQVRRVPVVDHAGTLVGIIAQADLAVDFARGEQRRELRMHAALGRISMPAHPRRADRWTH